MQRYKIRLNRELSGLDNSLSSPDSSLSSLNNNAYAASRQWQKPTLLLYHFLPVHDVQTVLRGFVDPYATEGIDFFCGLCFAITFHRDKRSKHALHSELDDISGIGTKNKEKLLKEQKNVKNISAASLETLTKTIGKSKAALVYEHFKSVSK